MAQLHELRHMSRQERLELAYARLDRAPIPRPERMGMLIGTKWRPIETIYLPGDEPT